jgi:cell division protein FtsI (penicillin-binding protein 3)
MVNDSHPHDWLSLQQIIKYSSNIGAVKISDITGRQTLYETLTNFGFGSKTGIGCPGDTQGILSSYRRWSKVDTGAISFGQGISVSAIQMVSAVSAIANGGFLVKPHIIEQVVSPSGEIIETYQPEEARRVISEKTANTVKRIMASVVTEGGTGVNAALAGYNVCGKTGTAQKISKKGTYSNDDYTASFVGFAPQDNPEITVIVALDEPKKEYYGGTVAAPAFRKIVHETLNYLNVEPEIYNETGKMLYAKRAGDE